MEAEAEAMREAEVGVALREKEGGRGLCWSVESVEGGGSWSRDVEGGGRSGLCWSGKAVEDGGNWLGVVEGAGRGQRWSEGEVGGRGEGGSR